MSEITYAQNSAGVYVPVTVSTAAAAASTGVATSTTTGSTNSGSGSSFGLTTVNPYASSSNSNDPNGTGQAASKAAAAAGLPYMSADAVNNMYNQTKNDSATQELKQQLLFFAQLNAGYQGSGTANSSGSGSGAATGQGNTGSTGGGAVTGQSNTGTTGGGTVTGQSNTGTTGGGTTGASGSTSSGPALNVAGVGDGVGGTGGNNGAGTAWGPANFAGTGAQAYASPIAQLSASARAAVNSTGQNVWALMVVALKGAMEDQNETLQYDLNKLQMYGKMSDQMSQYAQVLEDTQSNLDAAIQAQTNENDKGNQEVEMPTQLSFGPSSMFTLDNNGNMLPQTTSKPENAKNNANPVTSAGLNAKLQLFQQQRDQLQKNIDHWTNQYQSDNETKNQLTSTVTSILKNMYDMQSNVTRNVNL